MLADIDTHPECHPTQWHSAKTLGDLQYRAHSQRMIDLIALHELGLAVGVTASTADAVKSWASVADVVAEISEALAIRRAAPPLHLSLSTGIVMTDAVIPLTHPFKLVKDDAITLTQVTVSPPRMKTLRAMEKAQAGSDLDVMVALVIGTTGLTEADVNEMNPADFSVISKVASDFLSGSDLIQAPPSP